ncbi:MAG: hypothetical protein ACJ8IR_03450 [Alphaproteobacteria bacterium]|jgi:hypothetical protein
MLDRIFPTVFDNRYRGHWLGVVLFVLVILLKAVQGVNSIVMTRKVMIGADGIPLDRFNSIAADTAVEMFSLLGMYLLVLPLIGAVAVFRYRSMIPFLFLMLLSVMLGSRALNYLHPIARTAATGVHPIGFYVNLGILALTVIGFALSLIRIGTCRSSLPEGATR